MNERSKGEVLKQVQPNGDARIHGVTFDGKNVWFARDDELVAFDPERGEVVRRLAVPGASAGTAFDGKRLYQIAKEEILVLDPETGAVDRRLPTPLPGGSTGMAYADGHLWIGAYRERKVFKVDATTGEVVKVLASDRFVTGVSCVDGELWHGAMADGSAAELRQLGPDGEVLRALELPLDRVAGIERAAAGFWCAIGEGRLALVAAPARREA